jgi:preprotein translocase SecE subunit
LETPKVAKASKKDEPKKPKAKVAKKQQTVRERTKAASKQRGRRIRSTARRASWPIRKLAFLGKPLKFLSRLVPGFLKGAWHEIRLVTWPDARQTMRLTMAVFIFAVVFAAVVGALDYVIGEIFKEVIIR